MNKTKSKIKKLKTKQENNFYIILIILELHLMYILIKIHLIQFLLNIPLLKMLKIQF